MNFFSRNGTIALLSLATMVTAAGLAHAAPKQAAPANVDIKSMMIKNCADQAVSLKVLDAKSANKLCTCNISVQADKLSLGEYWQINSMAMSGKDPRGLPALQKIQPDLDKCKAGITLNPPQMPVAAAPAAAPKK